MKKRNKVTGFIWRTVKITLWIVLFTLAFIFTVLQIPRMQTFLGKKVSAYLSAQLNAKIDIKAVNIIFFKTINLEGIYIEDLHHDTLLYGDEVSCKVKYLSYANKKFELDITELKNITCKLIYYKGEKDLNIQFLADYFSGPSKTSKKDTTSSEIKIGYGNLHMENVRFVYKDLDYDDKPVYGMDYEDIEVSRISGYFSGLKIRGDSIAFKLTNLKAEEKCGIKIKQLNALTIISPRYVKVDSLLLYTDYSYIHGYYHMYTHSFDDFNHYIHNVVMQGNFLDSTYVSSKDIAYFAPELLGLNERIRVNGLIKGSVEDLSSNNLYLSWRNYSAFKGQLRIKGLPDIDSTFFDINAKQFTSHYNDLSYLKTYPFTENKKIDLPQSITTLGKISFNGKSHGFISNLLVNGNINTAIGKISAKADMHINIEKKLVYNGSFEMEKFNLGKFVDAKYFGETSLSATIKGVGTNVATLEAQVDGSVQSIQVNGYAYRFINVNGNFKKKQFSGHITVNDSNAKFNFLGNIDLTRKIPQAHFAVDIDKYDLFACKILTNDTHNLLSGKLSLGISGNTVDDMNASFSAEQVNLIRSNGIILLNNLDAALQQDNVSNSFILASDIADVNIHGKFKISTLPKSASSFLNYYYPTFFSLPKKNKKEESNLVAFKLRVKNFEPVATFFKIPLQISNSTVVQGNFDAAKQLLLVSGISDKIDYNKTPVKDLFLSVNTRNNQMIFNTSFKRVDLSDSIYIGNLNIDATTQDNKSNFVLTWNNQSEKRNSGEIDGKLAFTQNSLDLDLGKFFIYAQDSLWQMIGNDRFVIDSNGVINFNDLAFVNNNQHFKIEGKISPNPKDQLFVSFENFKLNQLNPLIKRNEIDVEGSVTGTASVADIYKQFVFTTALNFNRLKINDIPIGCGEINSFYDKNKSLVSLNGFFKHDFDKLSENIYNNIHFDGYYYPSKADSSIDIDMHLYQLPLATIQPLVKDIFTIDKGSATGDIKLSGSFKKPQINGLLNMEEVKNFKVDYLNTSYDVSGQVKVYPDQIEFNDILLTDAYKNKATAYGNIFHTNFSKLKLDFDINPINFMALNTTSDQNTDYYGKAFCTGNIGLYGPPDNLIFDINAKTTKGTQFIIPLSGPGEVNENGFIRFVKIDSLQKNKTQKGDFSGIQLNFNLEATPDAEVQIILDEKTGDAIKATGRGNLNLNINTLGNFEMYGIYTIYSGSYSFTLENVINKKFDIDNGGTITWSGNPLDANINITATYKQRTSLAPFFPENISDNSGGGSTSSANDNNKRYPVDCKLHLTDKLLTPNITFGIELPTVSEVIRSQVMGYINNEQELNRQFFSLLLLRSFVTPLQLNQSGVNAGGAVGNNATEMLSNQLSSMLNKFTKSVNMGLNYRPGTALSNEEIDVALSTQLFNDKLTIDGNVGVNNNTQTKTSSLIGDINVDYKLTKDGKIHVKAFNRSNDNFQIATLGGQFTQGAGILYREEFNTMGDLYRKYLNRNKKIKIAH